MTLASRLCWPIDSAMTCGVVIPIDLELIETALLDGAAWLRHADPSELADDPRFATALIAALSTPESGTTSCFGKLLWPVSQHKNGQSQA